MFPVGRAVGYGASYHGEGMAVSDASKDEASEKDGGTGSTADTTPGDHKTDDKAAKKDEKAAAREEKAAKRAERKKKGKDATEKVKAGSDAIRSRIASVVWLVAVVCALILAIGALLTAMNAANQDNGIVAFITDTADALAGPLGSLFDFDDKDKDAARTKNTLVNWGIAAVIYLVVGKVLDRIIRP